MNDSELDARLKAAREPAPPADYAEEFPRRVLARLGSAPRPDRHDHRSWLPRLAWGLATATCVFAAFAIGHWRGQAEARAGQDALANLEFIRGTLAMFPNRVRAIVQDERGVNLILSDTDNVPASTPIYVRICDGKHCSSLVTFSGQEIQIAGQKLTVLSQPDGGIILEGNQFVWSSSEPVHAGRKWNIEAKNLGLNPI